MMTRTRQFGVLAVLAAIGWSFGVGCAPEFEEPTCQTDDDCFSDEQCVEGVCRLAGGGGDAGPGGDADTGGETAEGEPVALGVSPETVDVAVGREARLHAVVFDADGNRLADADVQWTSTQSDIAAIVDSGGEDGPDVAVVKGGATGTSTITAELGDLQASAEVTVVDAQVQRLEVAPAAAELEVDQTVELSATPYDADGNELQGRQITWESADDSIAEVDDSGVVTGEATGEVEITATAEGASGSATVTVTERGVAGVAISPADPNPLSIGGTRGFVAMPEDSQGNDLCSTEGAEDTETPCGWPVTWTSGSPTIAEVDATGTVTGSSAGTVRIFAEIGGQTDTVELEVRENMPPTADAGSDQVADVSASVTLDGSSSDDPDSGDTLSYNWSVTTSPSGASPTLGSPMMAQTSFSADTAGDYTLELTVDDQSGASNATATDTVSVTVSAAPGASGDLVVSEIMDQPSDSAEWFEAYNASGKPLNLNGCTLATPGGATTNESTSVGSDLRVEAGGYATFATNSSPGFTPDYDYSGALTLEDAGDEVTVTCSSTQIDAVQYDGGTNFPSTSGATKRLDENNLDATSNDSGTNWCDADSTFGSSSDLGSPGSANGKCP